jgi:hypothetical protein
VTPPWPASPPRASCTLLPGFHEDTWGRGPAAAAAAASGFAFACMACSVFVVALVATRFVVERTGEVARVRTSPARPAGAGLADVAVAS